jgi:hypothetical protein
MTFDADAFAEKFMSSGTNSALSTERTLVPAGQYLLTILDDVGSEEYRTVHLRKGVSHSRDGEPRPWMLMNVPCQIQQRLDDPSDQTCQGRLVTYTLFLDLKFNGEEIQGLDTAPGANIKLGKLREAVNQNNVGEDWTPHNLGGQVLVGDVRHNTRTVNGEERTYAEVVAVAPTP